MAVPTVRFRNNDEAAHAVYQTLTDGGPALRHFTLRAFSYRSQAYTDWWLVPGRERPAYPFSKLLFHRVSDESDLMFVGFHVERGLGRQLGQLVEPARMMQPGWYWRRLLNEVQAGVLDAPVRKILARSEQPVVVEIELFRFNQIPEPDIVYPWPDDRVAYEISDPTLALVQTEEAGTLLQPLDGVIRLELLIPRVESLPKLSWYWVNLRIGIRVRYGSRDRGDWGAEALWQRAFEPWLPWVR